MDPFVTYPVVYTGKKYIVFPVLIGVLLLSAGIAAAMGDNMLATILFSLMIAFVIISAIVIKGRFLSFDLSGEQLIIIPEQIISGKQQYNIKEARQLLFTLHSFKGMEIESNKRKRYTWTSDGMDNYVSFQYNGKKVSYRFYLNSKKHTQLLCEVFREWYKSRIPFVEVDMYGQQTYLMQVLDKEQLEEFKKKYGYT